MANELSLALDTITHKALREKSKPPTSQPRHDGSRTYNGRLIKMQTVINNKHKRVGKKMTCVNNDSHVYCLPTTSKSLKHVLAARNLKVTSD